MLKNRLFHAGVSKIEIERAGQNMRVAIHTARPGIIIGKKGAEVEKLRKDLQLMTGRDISIDIK
jgi:small subunit ribosomal protein S3